MANTRNRNANAENNVENNNAATLPLPPPTLQQVLTMEAQMPQTMQQTMVNMQNVQPQAPPSLSRDRLVDFQRTNPPTFSHAVESMDADDWLKSVEKKLQVVQCNNCEKVLLASDQLSGPAADWWDAYIEAHREPESINWPEFRATFRAHHVPQCVIKPKKKEF
jgi:isochorismate synthase EntC